jgi:acyl transferase domain-containing protein/thioesterase domain-containing protein
MTERYQIKDSDIAIIGLAGRFPGATDSEAFWQNLCDGVESIVFFSEEELIASGVEATILKQPNYVKAGARLAEVELFDAAFFDFSPREAEITDPQHRIFLECAWESLENAGYDPSSRDNVIGVYAGASENTYLLNNLAPHGNVLASGYSLMISNGRDFLPTRVSYKLNLSGPSINVQTACSTSLVAVHLACQSLLNCECDMALAGGVSIVIPQKVGYWYQEGMINSPDGHCRAFDAKAKGTVGGDGVGIVVLKTLAEALADGDHIYATIKGSAINNDGALKMGYTAPSVEGQAAVISEAQAVAGVDAETINYIETHGTGTELGDPIEIAALTEAFRVSTDKKGCCAIGSLKTNIGHTDAAAGVAGLIKTVLALKHRLLPPSLHFEQPNPQIDFANSPFYVNQTLSAWPSKGTPRRAGVSSFGIGGTNAHVILEEAPAPEPSGPSRSWQLLVLSAKTPAALDTSTANLANYLTQHPDIKLADVAYTLNKGRQSFQQRRISVGQNTLEVATALQRLDPQYVLTACQPLANRPVVFMFSGQGAQYVNMADELYQTEPIFREEVDNCSDYLKPLLGLDLRSILYPSPEQLAAATSQLNQTVFTQTALFVIEYALAKLWMSYGIYPQAMIGHSIGEYVAAGLANVWSLEDALSLVASRGQLMQSLPTGAMLAIFLPAAEIQPWLHPGLALAAINGPRRCVVSGPTAAVAALQNQLTQQGVECRRLLTSHAFHSEMMNPMLAGFTARVQQVTLREPQIPYISNVTGTWITPAEATNPNYWATHLRQTVRFADGLQTLLADSARIFLEVGPGRTLSTLAKQHPSKVAEHRVLSSLRHPHDEQSDIAFLLNTLGQLWLAGNSVDWRGFYAHERRQRLPLPTYPFERQRYWIEPPHIHQLNPAGSFPNNPKPAESVVLHSRSESLTSYVAPRNQLEQMIAAIWAKVLGIEQIGIYDNFFELGGDSLLAVQVITQLRETLQIELDAHSLLNKSTIIALVELIAENNSKSSSQTVPLKLPACLVTIQTGNTLTPPLFLMHPVGGHVYFYRELVEQLGSEQPVYGLQAQGVDGKTEPLTQVEEMATLYVKAVRALQPTGPYFLGGASFGGTLAFEMAQQLHALGQKVALLALIDTPGLGHLPVELNDSAEILAYMLELSYEISVSVEELRPLKLDEQLDYLKQIKIPSQELTDLDLTQFRATLKLFQTHSKAMRDYIPSVYPGKIVFFRAQERDAYLPHNPERAWIDLALEGIEVHIVPGNHITMNELPHVQILAKRLQICLEQTKTTLQILPKGI